MADPAEEVARQLHVERRAAVLRRLLHTDRRLDEFYERAGARIRRRLRASGFTDLEVASILREELEAVETSLLPLVEADIVHAAESGDETAQRTLRLLEAVGGNALPFRPGPPLRLLRASSPRPGSEGGSRSTG